MIRTGEMMVIIRAQDFASRTIHKVSGELASMQRQRLMQARSYKQYLPALRQEAALLKQATLAQHSFAKAAMVSGSSTFGWTKAGQAAGARLTALKSQLAAVRKELAGLPPHLQAIRGNVPAIDQLATSIRKLEAERLHRVGAAMSGIGRTMQLFGAVGTAAFALMANSFGKFSASAATAGTQMRDLGGSTAQAVARSQELQKAILEMAQVFPNSAQDMTDAAYEIFSSMNLMHNGVMDVNSGLHLLAVANKAAVAGGVDLKEATNAMIVALNIFDPKLHDVTGTMNEVFNIVRFGRIRLDDLSHVFTQFASAAHAGGMSLKEVGAAFATLTLFNDPGKASAGLGRLIELLRTPDFREGLDKLIGVKVIAPDTGKMKPLLQIMQEIVKARPDLAASRKAAVDFFIELTKASGLTKKGVQGTVQARRAFETFATHMDTFADTVANVNKNYDEMNKSFESRMTDPGVQWELFKNRMKALALVIGKEVLPVFIRIGNWIANAIHWFQGLNGGVSGTIMRFAAWAAVGTLIAGVLLSLGGGIIQTIATLRLLSIAAKATGESFIAMRTMMIASGIGVIAVAAGVAAVMVMKHWDQVRAYFHAWFDDVGAGFKHFWAERVSEAKGAFGLLIMGFGKLREAAGLGGRTTDFGRGIAEQAGKELSQRSDEFLDNYNKWLKIYKKQRGKGGMDWLKDFKRITSNFDGQYLSREYKKWAQGVKDSTYTAAQAAKDHAQAVKQATENMTNSVEQAAKNLANIYDQLRDQNQAAMKGLFQGPTMTGVLGGVFQNINDALRQFGVQIPVPFNILKKDMDQSVAYFKRWRNDIARLLKRGMPIEMVQQIQELGPDAGIPIAEGLLQGGKSGWKSLIKEWKHGQTLIDKATKQDMNNKLKLWNSYGKDAAWATIMGIINNPRNFKITKMYESYVRSTYGSILKKVFQDDVATYMANAMKMAQAAATTAVSNFPKMPNLFAPNQNRNNPLANLTPHQLTKAYIKASKIIYDYQHFIGPPSPIQTKQFMNAQRRRRNIMAEYRRDAAASAAVRRQYRRGEASGKPTFNVTYQGDTVTIKADGATVESVARALARKHFQKKHKKKAPAANPYPGRS